jgi:hypothetical protein
VDVGTKHRVINWIDRTGRNRARFMGHGLLATLRIRSPAANRRSHSPHLPRYFASNTGPGTANRRGRVRFSVIRKPAPWSGGPQQTSVVSVLTIAFSEVRFIAKVVKHLQ